jgi:predicted Zn-dependent protease
MSPVIARIAVALVALAVLAWLGVMERDARLLARGIAATGPRADLPRAESELRAARLLNPDTRADIFLAATEERLGRRAQSVATLEDVLRREPDNLGAWTVLAYVARDDPVIVRRTLAARARLDPVNARR